jgi:nucleoside-diphosphate-sugar epimerase
MRVLVTGATGYIGSAVAEAVAAAGYEAHGLAHSGEAATELEARGFGVARGDLLRPQALTDIARGFDAVIHAAHVGGPEAAAVDGHATRALLRGLSGLGGAFVYTSGVWVLGGGRSNEFSRTAAPALVGWRPALEAEVLATSDVRGIVVRPGVVYGRGAGIPAMLARGELPVVGDGEQRWPLVHVDALAELYVRGLAAPAGSILHGVTATLALRDLALLAAAATYTPVPRISLQEARARLGDFADALALDQQVSARITRELVGWQSSPPSPVEEFLAGSYARTPVG